MLQELFIPVNKAPMGKTGCDTFIRGGGAQMWCKMIKKKPTWKSVLFIYTDMGIYTND